MYYDFAAIEKKWQANWEKTKPYAAVTGDKRPKFYGLIEFPYPSGQGLHVGHPRPFTAMDIVTRKKRMEGYNVLFPIGFDAFGLPTENYAIKNHIHPAVVTKNNIANFTSQLKMLGYGFDWDRCVDTTDPDYYKWTQWIFLQMFKHGLAYKTTMPVNWCTSCKCVLANEEVVNGVCERCGSDVIRKEKSQWMLKITAYAQRLIDDLEDVDFIERVKIQQRNWIGRSTGAEVTFQTNVGDEVTVYTTRADTLFGTTYMVISPEHPMLKKWQPLIKNWDAVEAYQEEAAHKSDFERGELNKEKTGVRLEGIEVMNPVTHQALPMFVSDYVLMGYGTGIVMGVPGHDQRDWDFAKAFGIPIVEVVEGGDIDQVARTESVKLIVEQMKQIAGRYAPIFVTGDMNASYAAGDGRRTCLDGFFEFMWSARETAPDGEADDVYSYNNFGEGTPRFTWNIDHIFYRKVTPVRFRTINNDGYGVPYISDHFPILFTSEF